MHPTPYQPTDLPRDGSAIRVRPCSATYIVASVWFGFFTVFLGQAAIVARSGQLVLVMLVVIGIYLAIILSLRGYQITVSSEQIRLRRFLRREVLLKIRDIVCIDIDIDLSRRGPPVLLVFDAKTPNGVARYSVNAKLFKMSELNQLIDFVHGAEDKASERSNK